MKDINDVIMLGAKEIHDLREENKRLNNIINELENYIKVELKHVIPMWSLETHYSFGESTIYGYILDKLQELKGEDKK